MRKKIVIIGAGGFAREVLDVLEACNQEKPSYDVLGYIVDAQYGAQGTIVNERPILGDFDWLREHVHDVFAICGVATPHYRRRLVLRAKEMGCKFSTVVHPSAVLTGWEKVSSSQPVVF
jgi:FlaA1/EpsC-like NDP-sugar epimerase